MLRLFEEETNERRCTKKDDYEYEELDEFGQFWRSLSV